VSVERDNEVVAKPPEGTSTLGTPSANTRGWDRDEFVSDGVKLTGPEKFWKLVRFRM